jgi:hypothetical protein
MRRFVGLLLAAALLPGCDDIDTDEAILQKVVEANRIGYGPNQWLEQYAPGRGEWDKLALARVSFPGLRYKRYSRYTRKFRP